MDYNYVIWDNAGSDVFCSLEGLSNVDDHYELRKGASFIDRFPADACFHMYRDKPKAVKLADSISNFDSLPVVSRKLMEFVKSHESPSVEFLPVTIINHKGRVASKDYFIIHPLVVQDCIDLEATKVDWNPINPEAIVDWDGTFTLDINRMDGSLLFFRPKYKPTAIIVRRDLAEAIQKQGFTGLYFMEMYEYEA